MRSRASMQMSLLWLLDPLGWLTLRMLRRPLVRLVRPLNHHTVMFHNQATLAQTVSHRAHAGRRRHRLRRCMS